MTTIFLTIYLTETMFASTRHKSSDKKSYSCACLENFLDFFLCQWNLPHSLSFLTPLTIFWGQFLPNQKSILLFHLLEQSIVCFKIQISYISTVVNQFSQYHVSNIIILPTNLKFHLYRVLKYPLYSEAYL